MVADARSCPWIDAGAHVRSSDTDGSIITGRWETSQDGSTWEHDFDLTYRKVTSPG